jgi:hypothetical protein
MSGIPLSSGWICEEGRDHVGQLRGLVKLEDAILLIILVCSRENEVFVFRIDRKSELPISEIPREGYAAARKGRECWLGKRFTKGCCCSKREEPSNVIGSGMGNSEITDAWDVHT